jgi:hypothetical protein
LQYPGLAAKYGGPIDVLEHIVRDDRSGAEQIELLFFEPRFNMEITLDHETAVQLRPGQIGFVLAAGPTISLKQKIQDFIEPWIRKKDQAATARGV